MRDGTLQALSIDPKNATKQHEKLYFRRGLAFMAMREWERAVSDLRQPVLASSAVRAASALQQRRLRMCQHV